jgi:DAHP synthase ferredoxin-like domain
MLIVMRKTATEDDLRQVKEALSNLDLDFHQSTGSERTILGVIGDTSKVKPEQLRPLPGVLEVFKIPSED